MLKLFIVFALIVGSLSVARSKDELQGTSAVELQMACNRLHSAKNLRNEWQLDFKQASEKWMEIKKIEGVFEPLADCQERTNSLHQSLVRTDSLMEMAEKESNIELKSFSIEGEKCKSKEKADRLKLVLERMESRLKEFKATSDEAALLHRKQVNLAEALEGARPLPSELEPKIEVIRERLKNAVRLKQSLERELREVQNLEKKYESERNALIQKYQGTKVEVPPPQVCDKAIEVEWLKETERLTAQMQEMIDKGTTLKPTFLTILKCKPIVDDALLEKTALYPKNLAENIESRKGPFVIDRCLATAKFYEEVALSLQQAEESEKNRRRMKEKEEDSTRRASSTPSLRKQTEAKRSLSSVPDADGGVR